MFLLTALVADPISYLVTPAADLSSIRIDITIPCQGETVDLAMPSWSPGYYVQENYGENLKSVTAMSPDGKTLTVTHPRPDTWHVDTQGASSIKVSYSRTILHESGRMGIFSADADTVHYGGPSIYLYVVGRKETKCLVRFGLQQGWGLAVALDPRGETGYEAPSYDVLADSPVTMGKFRTAHYTSRGKGHLLAIRGTARDRLNLDQALKMTKFISESETDFFGGSAPYSRYVWHIWAGDTGDGAGGLEHASSSQDYLSLVEGPASMRGLAHECFHLWNVKRIRSSVLGPFDYTRLPRTGALWWLEGVTDYYASLIPHRYGWYGDGEYLKDIGNQIREVRSNPKRLEVSPYESSFRVGEAANGRGNSNGFGVSYYPTGWLLGMLFDIEIRSRTGGEHSLDDVELGLWNLCKDGKPGFPEDELRRRLVSVGGEELGPLFDKWVMSPGELPVEDVLRKVGLEVSSENGRVRVTESKGATSEQIKLREGWFWGKKHRPTRLLGES
ncbi:MAG TPA: hypothetical protein VG944_13660 [Fimbriimonas sp.]|nr:hypothetical protein [Fimbriimonas sp.]